MDFTAKLAVVHNDALMVFKGYMTYIIRLDRIQSLSKDEEHTRLVYYVRSGEKTTLTLALEYYKAIRDALRGCLAGKRWLQEFRAGTVSPCEPNAGATFQYGLSSADVLAKELTEKLTKHK